MLLNIFSQKEVATIFNEILDSEFVKTNDVDSYLDEESQYFSQKSANEGFLLLLFYITLFVNDYTPKFLP